MNNDIEIHRSNRAQQPSDAEDVDDNNTRGGCGRALARHQIRPQLYRSGCFLQNAYRARREKQALKRFASIVPHNGRKVSNAR